LTCAFEHVDFAWVYCRSGKLSRNPKVFSLNVNGLRLSLTPMAIWQRAVEISGPVFELADNIELQKKFRFSEQLRAAMLSVSNNMAEGSGSCSDKDFAHYLNISRRSIFEVASMMLVFHNNQIIPERPSKILTELIELSKMTFAFRNTLKSD